MNAQEVRQKFLDFFESKQHQVVPSAPLVNKDDPTLMFTNAGMNQFKDFFLGNKKPEHARVVDTQKCLRVSGKHNDLEEVGMDTYHHTMFEMLGNWSFGDYFKKEAIEWAWELLTKEYALPADRLYVTVFGGDKEDNLGVDQEAFDYWKEILPESRILYGSKKDNFWEMGDTGPCGPCSEIHIDLRDDQAIAEVPGKDLVNKDHPLVVEIWNLVFMEFNRMASGELKFLPAKHVDTGMGFERLCMAIQKKTSNYDTDVFTPLIGHITSLAGITYGKDTEKDIAVRVMVDHVRAIAFAVADGQLPSNTGAGYVIRRILRRAVRYGYTFLSFSEPVLYSLVDILVEQTREVFPSLAEQKEFVKKVIEKEEESFLKSLENGLKKLENIKQSLEKEKSGIIPGEQVFELYDTYGFPVDLTSLIAREYGLKVDEGGFKEAMAGQKSRSRADAVRETGDWVIIAEGDNTRFVGYEKTTSESHILRYRTLKIKGKDVYQLVLDQTPFYAESGGQVGDTGTLTSEKETIHVRDTTRENDLIVHQVEALPKHPELPFQASVAEKRRLNIIRNHSATHLLHAALRSVLGDHVEQRGSLVNEKILRFDFSHFERMSEEEIRQVEHMVNQKIRQNIPLEEQRDVPMEKAKAMGAMALFGEKYGNSVRVITFDKNYSVELCGGIHTPATGVIGFFKIISESSISAGIRRIEAVTGEGAENYVEEQLEMNRQIRDLLRNPTDVTQSISQLIEQRNELEKTLEKMQYAQTGQVKQQVLSQIIEKEDFRLLIARVSLPSADMLKKISFELKKEVENLVLVLAADIEGKPQISVAVDEELIKKYKLHAGNIVRDLAKEIQGGGGGQPFFATAGGKNVSGLDQVIARAKEMLSEITHG
jgi:alanyl-tRNA synthetase